MHDYFIFMCFSIFRLIKGLGLTETQPIPNGHNTIFTDFTDFHRHRNKYDREFISCLYLRYPTYLFFSSFTVNNVGRGGNELVH